MFLKRKQDKRDAISYQMFNRLVPNGKIPMPVEDSPGDSGEDEVTEMAVGMDYPEGWEFEDEWVPADFLAKSADDEHESATADDEDQTAVISSPRPDPIQDLDSARSTH